MRERGAAAGVGRGRPSRCGTTTRARARSWLLCFGVERECVVLDGSFCFTTRSSTNSDTSMGAEPRRCLNRRGNQGEWAPGGQAHTATLERCPGRSSGAARVPVPQQLGAQRPLDQHRRGRRLQRGVCRVRNLPWCPLRPLPLHPMACASASTPPTTCTIRVGGPFAQTPGGTASVVHPRLPARI